MPKFKTNSQYTEYLKNKYQIKDLTLLSNYIAIDAYQELINIVWASDKVILKGAFNLLSNFNYERDEVTRDIDISIRNASITDYSNDIKNLIQQYSGDIYSFKNVSTKKLSIATSKNSGERIDFRIYINGLTINDRGNIDIAFEEIEGDEGLLQINGKHFYSIERTIADKYVSAIFWGESNSRTKDFYDIKNLFTDSLDKQLFIRLVKKLILIKELDEEKINNWLKNYKHWSVKHEIEGLEEILEKINLIIF